jgi:hypothetical protein
VNLKNYSTHGIAQIFLDIDWFSLVEEKIKKAVNQRFTAF